MSKILLPINEKKNIFYTDSRLQPIKDEIEEFLLKYQTLDDTELINRLLLSLEVKSNNANEGYYDDIRLIENILAEISLDSRVSSEQRKRILNLFQGYQYVLTRPCICKENLSKLYFLLSNGLLSSEDKADMGEFYRTSPVYILYSNNPDVSPDMGIPEEDIVSYMDKLFEYANQPTSGFSKTDIFVCSQILHFYLVHIHPYYDINGRTARTLGIWYLLNNGMLPFLIFNRAITLDKKRYYTVIREARRYSNLTYFLEYMLKNTKIELEKEFVIDNILASISGHLSLLDRQTLQYILSMRADLTLLDFVNFYNRFSGKSKPHHVYRDALEPLLDKGVIVKKSDTSRAISGNYKNFFFGLNPSVVDVDKGMVRRIDLQRKI